MLRLILTDHVIGHVTGNVTGHMTDHVNRLTVSCDVPGYMVVPPERTVLA